MTINFWKNMLRPLLPFLCLFLIILNPFCQASEVKLNRLMESLSALQQEGILDGEVLIAKGETPIFQIQSSDIHREDPQFMIGSVTKQFYAAALCKALYESSTGATESAKIQDVKKKLHQPIVHFLPKGSALWQGKMPSWAYKVTIHQLLSHTSGIANYTECDEYFEADRSGKLFYECPREPYEILQLINEKSLLFSPGTDFYYSNTGYVLVAQIIQAITLMPPAEYVQKALFDPLGLSSTFNPTKGNSVTLQLTSECHRLVPEKKYDPRGSKKGLYASDDFEEMSLVQGDGSIISTAKDLLKWNIALHKDHTVLPKPLYKLMITENLNHYGYGIGINEGEEGLSFGHTGEIGSYQTLLVYYPEQELSLVVLCHVGCDWEKWDRESRSDKQPIRGFEKIEQLLQAFERY